MNETRYPLCWPANWKRTAPSERKYAKFVKVGGLNIYGNRPKDKLSVWDGVLRIQKEIRSLGLDEHDAIISTNVQTRQDGIPRSDRAEPSDPGAAVYWKRNGKQQCMAIDRYDRVADNLAAIAATLEYFRGIERHGGGAILDRAFVGFAQLPASIVTPRPWREVFRFGLSTPTVAMMEARYRKLAHERHPDKGGTHDQMAELNAARAAAFEELAG